MTKSCSGLLWIAGLFAFICMMNGATADPHRDLLPGIVGGTRHVIRSSLRPWRMLGRVQSDLGMRCTGFLVAPSVVLTAAHCLYLPLTGNYLQPSSVHFLLGYDRGSFRAEASAKFFVIPPRFDPEHPLTTSQFDHATIILTHPVGSRSDLLPLVAPRAHQLAQLVGYEQDRVERAYGDLHCHVLRVRGSLIDHDCAATHGASGAPLLVKGKAGWGIAGIDVSANPALGGTAVRMRAR